MNDAQTPIRWKLIFARPADGAHNMARDLALLQRAKARRECVMCVYSWARPTLSLGRNQIALGYYDPSRIQARNIDVVRRPTGGRAILHFKEATYSVTGPDNFAGSLNETYERINAIIVAALNTMGVVADISRPISRAPKPDQSPCFQEPVKGEISSGGKKLVGSAQYREAGAFLQHGSILIDDDQSLLSELMNGSATGSSRINPPATLSGILGRQPAVREIANALFAAVRALEDIAAEEIEEKSLDADSTALRAQFVDPEWTWRR